MGTGRAGVSLRTPLIASATTRDASKRRGRIPWSRRRRRLRAALIANLNARTDL